MSVEINVTRITIGRIIHEIQILPNYLVRQKIELEDWNVRTGS
jgi:hypothetical protein